MRTPTFLALLVLVSSSLAAEDVPLTNWTVPPYRGLSASGGLTTMADISPGIGFVAMQPCRIVDTRGGGVFTGAYGPPIMAANAIRPFDLNSSPHCTGIPAGVEAYSLNFTATQTAGPSGDIRAWPTGNPPVQVTSVLNWTVTNAVVANAIIVPAGTNGFIDVQVAGSNTHLLIDINGYFTDQYNPGNFFHAVSADAATPAIRGDNTSPLGFAIGVLGQITSTTTSSGSAGVRGINAGTGPSGVGVWGSQAGGGWGVFGETSTGYGVIGKANAISGASNGVVGMSSSLDVQSNGVLGIHSADPRTAGYNFTTGVRGAGTNAYGVVGDSRLIGVIGTRLFENGFPQTAGYLGYNSTDGVYSSGNIAASGTKPFVEPHPIDPAREIAYVALEGPEAGTYFRGKGRFQRGLAEIAVPESFRMVTDSEGLSIQITPIGEMATVAVVSLGLDRIVVKGSRDVDFFYTVNGVRQSFKDWEVIQSNTHYVPEEPGARMPLVYAPEQRRRLIATGIYNADGTVNMETARRLGWDKEWEKRSRPTPLPTPE